MKADDRAWFANRRVLVTGHTGFKGAWLCLWLQQMGATVHGYALAPLTGSLYDRAGVGSGMGSTIADIRDRASLERVISDFDPEVVIHMAAQAFVRASYADPVATFDINVMGSVNVLDVLRTALRVKSVVIVTSDKCYENTGASRPFREEDAMGGSDPYSSSKGCTELVTTSFVRSFFSQSGAVVGSARAGNVVGGGDWGADRLVPDLMRALAKSESTYIRRPDAVRPWQFVLEPLRGYLMLARHMAEHGREYAGAWNFGPSYVDMVSVRELVGSMQTIWPALSVDFATEVQGPHEAEILRLDSAKTQSSLGWRPQLSVQQTAEMTVDWYRRVYEDPNSARQTTLDQLRQYGDRFDHYSRRSLQ